MDLTGTISRLLNLYAIFKSKGYGTNGVGLYCKRYSVQKGVGFLYVILSAPKKPTKGKEKELEAVLDKSSSSGKIIHPKDFIGVRNYLSTIFPQIIKPADQIADIICELIAGFRLELVPFQNMKYTFNDPKNPDIIIYDDDKDGQFSFYISIVNLKETGLILAYERQLNYIREQIKKGVNPITIKNLPPLRTGTTEIELRNKQGKSLSAGIQKLHQTVQGKKTQEEIAKELEYSTVIDSFSPEKKDSQLQIPSTDSKKPVAPIKKPAPQGFFQIAPAQPFPTKASMPSPTPPPKSSSNPFEQVKNLIASDFPKVEEPVEDTKFVVNPEVEKLKKELDTVQQNLEVLKKENESLLQKLEQLKLDDDNNQADKHRLEVENELIKKQLRETTDSLTAAIQKKEEDLKNFKALSSQNQEASMKLITQLQEKDTKIQQLTQKNSEIQENLNFVKTQVENFQQILTEKEVVIQQITKENGQISDSLDQLIAERNEFEEKWNNLQNELHKFHQQKEEFDKKMLELTEENEQLGEAIKEADVKYQAIFEEHKNCLKKQIKAENPPNPDNSPP